LYHIVRCVPLTIMFVITIFPHCFTTPLKSGRYNTLKTKISKKYSFFPANIYYRPDADIQTQIGPTSALYVGLTSGCNTARHRADIVKPMTCQHAADIIIHQTVPIEPFFRRMNMSNMYMRAHTFDLSVSHS